MTRGPGEQVKCKLHLSYKMRNKIKRNTKSLAVEEEEEEEEEETLSNFALCSFLFNLKSEIKVCFLIYSGQVGAVVSCLPVTR